MKTGNDVKLAFVGDMALNGGYENFMREGNARTLAESIRSLVVRSDLVIGNLEGPLTKCKAAGPPWRFHLHGDPAYASALRAAGIDVLTLANNHAMDHGWEGLRETEQVLEAAGIRYLGAGQNLEQARKPLFIKVGATTVGIVACCDVPTGSSLYAEQAKPGIAPLRRSLLFEDIANAKRNCDCLILCIHWGQENIGEPAPRYRRLARAMVQAGVNIVVGHHPHVLQGTEVLPGGIIAYSLGNFTFSNEMWVGTNQNGESFSLLYKLGEKNRESAIWKVTVNVGANSYAETLVPVYLGEDLLPTFDSRPERKIALARSNAALKMHPYPLLWAMRMMSSRFKVILEGLRGEEGFANRLRRLRPRHICDLWRLLAREWEQFKGTEQR